MAILIDIGCGDNKLDGALGIDFRKDSSADVLADALRLPFRDESIDHVFSSYLIEHYSHRAIKDVLGEWVRILKLDGLLELRCPNLRARALLFVLNPTWHSIVQIFGEQDHAGNFHKSGFNKGLLKEFIKSVGIVDIKDVFEPYRGIPFIPRCIHYVGRKAVR